MKSIYVFFAALSIPVVACGGSPAEKTHNGGQAVAADACTAPTDCTGLLPRNTEPCADGTSQGAQWDCTQGQCAISYCDDNGGPAN